MKVIKSLILTLVLAGAAYAGEIGQPAPQPPPVTAQAMPGDIPQPLKATPASQRTTQDAVTEMLVYMVSFLSLT